MASVSGTTTYPLGVGTWVRDAYDLAAYNSKITVNNKVTYDCSYCGDYAVYYVNKYGGWDAFLFEGLCKRIDNLTDYRYNRSVNNQTRNFENNRYMVEVNPTYQLTTGWLSDEEAARLASNLFPTTKLYLHNLTDDTIVPAIVQDTQAEYKTFRTNGKKFVQYTVNIEESHTKIRR